VNLIKQCYKWSPKLDEECYNKFEVILGKIFSYIGASINNKIGFHLFKNYSGESKKLKVKL
jgi:hypothetical protein